jgi:hypothetical protein
VGMESKIWSFGPRRCGANVLVDQLTGSIRSCVVFVICWSAHGQVRTGCAVGPTSGRRRPPTAARTSMFGPLTRASTLPSSSRLSAVRSAPSR